MTGTVVLQILTLIAIGILVLVAKKALPAYFSEKGRNLATKEDIEEITRKVEAVRADVARNQAVDTAKRQLKYEACLDALVVIDAYFSQLFKGATPQAADAIRARECHSKLILSCDNVALVEKYFEILVGPRENEKGRPPTDLLNDFRNLIREELGFGTNLVLDRDRAWLGRVAGDPKNSEQQQVS